MTLDCKTNKKKGLVHVQHKRETTYTKSTAMVGGRTGGLGNMPEPLEAQTLLLKLPRLQKPYRIGG